MRLQILVASAGLATAQVNTNVGNQEGILKVQGLLDDFKAKLDDEGHKAAKLWEQESCTANDAIEEFKGAIATNQASHEEAEGVRQASQEVFDHLDGPKTLEGSIAHSKNHLAMLQSNKADTTSEKKTKGAEAMKTISQAEEGILLVESAEAALQATTESVNAMQSFLQVKAKLSSMGLTMLPEQEQPKAHITGHSTILTMLDKLKTDITTHLEDVRSEWTIEQNRLVKIIQGLEAEIATTKTTISDDSATRDDERASVLAQDQKLHGLKLKITSDTASLKDTTDRWSAQKAEYEADQQTRLAEMQAVSSALRVLNEKFAAAPTPAPPANAGEEGEATPLPCGLDPADEVVSIPSSFIQTFAQKKVAIRPANFLQRSEDPVMSASDYEAALDSLRSSNSRMRSPILATVVTSLRKKDPLKKIRTMIKNLIQKLKDEAISEKNRNEYCTTEETAKQEARTSKKKAMAKYETLLEKAQENIAESRASIAELEKQIAEAKKTCSEENGQLLFDKHLHSNNVQVAQHGKEALNAVMAELSAFFGDSAQADVESNYGGDTNAAQGITGMMEALVDDFQKTIDVSTEIAAKLNTESATLITTTSNEIADKREQERQEVGNELTPALESFKTNGSALHQTSQEYSLLTEELIVLKYDSEACSDKQLSKEEEAANKEAEIQALKDALAILENHGNN